MLLFFFNSQCGPELDPYRGVHVSISCPCASFAVLFALFFRGLDPKPCINVQSFLEIAKNNLPIRLQTHDSTECDPMHPPRFFPTFNASVLKGSDLILNHHELKSQIQPLGTYIYSSANKICTKLQHH